MGREGNPPHPPMMSPWSSWPGAFCALPQISCVGFAVNIAKLPDLEPVTRPGPPQILVAPIRCPSRSPPFNRFEFFRDLTPLMDEIQVNHAECRISACESTMVTLTSPSFDNLRTDVTFRANNRRRAAFLTKLPTLACRLKFCLSPLRKIGTTTALTIDAGSL